MLPDEDFKILAAMFLNYEFRKLNRSFVCADPHISSPPRRNYCADSLVFYFQSICNFFINTHHSIL